MADTVKLPRVWSGGALALPEPPIPDALAEALAAETAALAAFEEARQDVDDVVAWLDHLILDVADTRRTHRHVKAILSQKSRALAAAQKQVILTRVRLVRAERDADK